MSHAKRSNTPTCLRILKVLENSDTPLSNHQIAALAITQKKTVDYYRPLLIAEKKIHIARWDRNPGRGPFVAMLAFGPGPAVPVKKPRNLTTAEVCKRWRQKTAYNEYRRARDQLQRPDPITRALLGIGARA